MGKTVDHKKIINEAMFNNDFELALQASYDGYLASKNIVEYDSKTFLRLIRGFAEKILESTDNKQSCISLAQDVKCNFCGKDMVDSALTQGHSGVICNDCVSSIYKNIKEEKSKGD